MSFDVTVRSAVTTVETLDNDDLIAESQLTHSGYDDTRTLSATTTPDVTAAAYKTVAMVAGAGSVDLTALALNGVATSLSGTKPRALKVKALAANAGDVTVTKGASNGYTGLGAAFSVVLKPGMSVLIDFDDQGTTVGSGDKTIDLAGTGTDSVQVSAVAGTP